MGGGGGGGGKLVQFFSPGKIFYALPQFPAEKNCNHPPCMAQKVMTYPMLKDMTGIIKQDQLLPCAVHNRMQTLR